MGKRMRAVLLAAVITAMALSLTACQTQDAETGLSAAGSVTGADADGDGQGATSERGERPDAPAGGSGKPEEWPGQSLGYVGPNGEGVLDRDDFETDEEYREAAIDAAGKEVEVPFEAVEVEGEDFEYVKGKVWLDFREGCGEKRAREIVAECGGEWVSSTYKWGSRSAETYFPVASGAAGVTDACERLAGYDEVEAAYPEIVRTSGDLH